MNILLGRVNPNLANAVQFVAMLDVNPDTLFEAMKLRLDSSSSWAKDPAADLISLALTYQYPGSSFFTLANRRILHTVNHADTFAAFEYDLFKFRVLHIPGEGWYCKENNEKPWLIPGLAIAV